MRTVLAGLTLRGRAFLAAGLTTLACSLVLAQAPLARIGVLVVALPLISLLMVSGMRHRLSLERTVDPEVVPVGTTALVSLAVTNDARRPTGVLQLTERLPDALGTAPRFVLGSLWGRATRTTHYRVSSQVRGHFTLGPMTAAVTDPFGLVEQRRTFHSATPLVVTPRTVPLPAIPLSGAWSGGGENRPRPFATGSAEDVTVREYRRGDDLRRVHWRSTARAGELMVRREEQPWQSRATVLLDNRAHRHTGRGPGSTFEAAISAAASIVRHLGERGYGVRLATASGPESGGFHDQGPGAATPRLLEALAGLEVTATPTLATGWAGEGPDSGLVVAVLGRVDAVDVPALRRVQQRSGAALALAVSPTDAAAGSLVSAGWRAVDLRPQAPLAPAWQEVGHQGTPTRVGR